MPVPWTRLIRFHPQHLPNKVTYGEPCDEDGVLLDIGRAAESGRLRARVLEVDWSGPLSGTSRLTDEIVTVGKLLSPLGLDDVHDIKCIGLNYRKHILEAGRSLPPHPSLFIKPSTSLADYGEAVPIPKCAQFPLEADYEGELCAIIGQDCKNVSKQDALSYVAGYTVGDDVSTRKWQRDKDRAGGVPQWCFSKGFDKFAPLGPCIVSSELISDPANLCMTTTINGEERQNTSVGDLVFDVSTLVSFLSQGTTLRRGTVIMTGTPGGVGCTGPEEKWKPLRHGDSIEVWVREIGTLRHTIVYE